MATHFYIMLLVVFGFFLIPNQAVACEKKCDTTEKSCCHKEKESDAKQTNGCEKTGDSSSCHCSLIKVPMQISSYKSVEYYPSVFVKVFSSSKPSFTQVGFHSILIKPKIS
ncbi:hypothetical protein [Sphingobacterium hungaricum]